MADLYKHPDSRVDYGLDWRDWLAYDPADPAAVPDVIEDAQVAVTPAGELAVDGPATILGGIVAVWLTGGVAGSTYELACTITTAKGRTDTDTVVVAVRDA